MSLNSIPTCHLPSVFALSLFAAVSFLSVPFALAKAPMQRTQAPGFYRTMIGAFEVTALSDGTAEMPMDELLSEPGEKTREVLKEAHLDTPMEMSVNAYLINTGDRLILVDTGSGDGLGSSLGKLPKNIIAAGYKPDQIDDILLTHLHPDHVGGLVRNGAAVFPNAKIHASRVEATFWLSPSNAASVSNQAGFVTSVQASLAPYVASGRFQPFDGDAEVVSYVRARKAEGHTPGSVVYVIESNRERLLLIGDLIHAGPVQFADPAITFAFDSDPAKAANARRNVLGQAAADGDMIGAAHLPFPGLGYVRRELDAYRWLSINYSITFH